MHAGPAVFDLIRHPRLLDVIERLIGSEILTNPIQHVRIKPPEAMLRDDLVKRNTMMAAVAWHQDQGVALPEIDDTDILTVWFPVLDATIETVDAAGAERNIPIAEFHRLPGDAPERDTTLKRDELITAVTLPRPLGGAQVYRKVRDRASYAFALVSVAAVVQPDGTGRVAFGGLAHKPWRVEEAEGDLPRGARAAASGMLAGAAPTHDNAFKLVLAERTLGAALKQARA